MNIQQNVGYPPQQQQLHVRPQQQQQHVAVVQQQQQQQPNHLATAASFPVQQQHGHAPAGQAPMGVVQQAPPRAMQQQQRFHQQQQQYTVSAGMNHVQQQQQQQHSMGAVQQQQQQQQHHAQPIPSGYPAYALPGNTVEGGRMGVQKQQQSYNYPKNNSQSSNTNYYNNQYNVQQQQVYPNAGNSQVYPQQGRVVVSVANHPRDPNGNINPGVAAAQQQQQQQQQYSRATLPQQGAYSNQQYYQQHSDQQQNVYAQQQQQSGGYQTTTTTVAYHSQQPQPQGQPVQLHTAYGAGGQTVYAQQQNQVQNQVHMQQQQVPIHPQQQQLQVQQQQVQVQQQQAQAAQLQQQQQQQVQVQQVQQVQQQQVHHIQVQQQMHQQQGYQHQQRAQMVGGQQVPTATAAASYPQPMRPGLYPRVRMNAPSPGQPPKMVSAFPHGQQPPMVRAGYPPQESVMHSPGTQSVVVRPVAPTVPAASAVFQQEQTHHPQQQQVSPQQQMSPQQVYRPQQPPGQTIPYRQPSPQQQGAYRMPMQDMQRFSKQQKSPGFPLQRSPPYRNPPHELQRRPSAEPASQQQSPPTVQQTAPQAQQLLQQQQLQPEHPQQQSPKQRQQQQPKQSPRQLPNLKQQQPAAPSPKTQQQRKRELQLQQQQLQRQLPSSLQIIHLSSEQVAGPSSESTSSHLSQKVFVDKVLVPWGWRRLILSDSVIYYSPSGIQLKNMSEVRGYLLQEGTCKCGLECPMNVSKVFDFDDHKQSELLPFPFTSKFSRYCSHKKNLVSLATQDKSGGFISKIKHVHAPITSGDLASATSSTSTTSSSPAPGRKGGVSKRRARKKAPFSGLNVAQMLEAREAERQRINEIIQQQKRQHEAKVVEPPTQSSSQQDQKMEPSSESASNTEETKPGQKEESDSSSEPPSRRSSEEDDEGPPELEKQCQDWRSSVDEEESKKAEEEKEPESAVAVSDDRRDRVEEEGADSPQAEDDPEEQEVQEILGEKEKERTKPESEDDEVEELESGPQTERKNFEIRRMSATDDADKILQGAWTSPDKEKEKKTGKTPLQMVENIISRIEMPEAETLEGESSPAGLSPVPLNQGQKATAPGGNFTNQISPVLSQNFQTWPQTSRPLTSTAPMVSTTMTMTMAAAPVISQPQQQQPMMMVNTINGPMLMQAMPIAPAQGGTGQLLTTAQPSHSPGMAQPMTMVAPGGAGMFQGRPILKKRPRKKKLAPQVTPQQPRPGQIPMLMPAGVPVSSATSNAGPQLVAINQANQGSVMGPAGHQPILPQPNIMLNQAGQMLTTGNVSILSNGAQLVSMPTMQAGVVLNQLPDGTFYQVQTAPTAMLQQGQGPHLIPTGPILVNQGPHPTGAAPGQMIQGAPAGTFIMTPQGLVQAHPHPQQQQQLVAQQQISPRTQPMPQQSPGTEPGSSGLQRKPVSEQTRLPKKSISPGNKKSNRDVEDDDDDDSVIEESSDDEEEEAEVAKQREQLRRELERKKALSTPTRPGKSSKSSSSPSTSKGGSGASSGNASPSKRPSPSSISPGSKRKSTPEKPTFLQSNQVDSSGLKATPPHAGDSAEGDISTSDLLDTSGASGSTEDDARSGGRGSPSKRKKKKRNADELIKEALMQSEDDSDDSPPHAGEEDSDNVRQFSVGDVVWGPHGNFPSWPGKLNQIRKDSDLVEVCWFGSKEITQINAFELKNLSDGLEAHHRERKKLRKGRKMNSSLEKAIQEAMAELDRMTADTE